MFTVCVTTVPTVRLLSRKPDYLVTAESDLLTVRITHPRFLIDIRPHDDYILSLQVLV